MNDGQYTPRMLTGTGTIPSESELPEVTDLLQSYARTDVITSATAGSSTSTGSYIVRATNFDGRPVTLKRKMKKTSAPAVRSFQRVFLTSYNKVVARRRKVHYRSK